MADKIKTYIINLKQSSDRRQYIQKEVSNYLFLDSEFIEAVDGRVLPTEEIALLFDRKRFEKYYSRRPFPGEIGCTLSHRECYRKFLESEEEVALILEDDIHLLYEQDVGKVLQEAVCLLEKAPATLLYLQPPRLCWSFSGQQFAGNYKLYSMWCGVGSAIYLINRKGAQKMLSCSYPYWLADHYELFRLKGIHIKAVFPTFAAVDEEIAGKTDISRKIDVCIPHSVRWLFYRIRLEFIKRFVSILVFVGLLKLLDSDNK